MTNNVVAIEVSDQIILSYSDSFQQVMTNDLLDCFTSVLFMCEQSRMCPDLCNSITKIAI